MNLARPKSQTLTLKLWSISMLWLLMSLCAIPKWCMYSNTTAASIAIYNLWFIDNSVIYFFIWSISYNEPCWTCSKTMYIFGIYGMTPISIAILGWRSILYITISFWISFNNSSVSLGSKIFLIATGVPFSLPTWIVEKPPYPIFSPSSISSIVISRTPGTDGNLPALTDTFEDD